MNKNTIWACAITNMLSIACFTILALMFNKWWIALFAILFISFPSIAHKYYRTCDGCGAFSEPADDYNDALNKAKAAGWVHIVEGNKDYCPDCKKENGYE